jgi:NADH-quinone oxidoreductase subunit F
VRVEGGEPLVVANGHEGEPGSVKDRYVMLERPERLLEGLVLAARAVGAREAIVFLKGSFDGPTAAVEQALARADLDGLAVRLHRGEAAYVAGEETALVESLEGRRAWPRPKPPLPAAVGFAGRPTLVHNVETLARVPEAVSDPAAFARGERTLVSLWGDVRRPGVYEVPLGTPIARLIDEQGEGAPDGVRLVFPAGPSGAPLAPEALDTPLHPDALRAAGSALGTAAVLVVGTSGCPLSVAASLADFFERESCAQCPPCSVGTANLARIVRGLEQGGARPRDLGYLDEAARFMADHGYCSHTRTSAASVTGTLARLREEVEQHLAHGGCPRRASHRDPFSPGSPERAAIEAALDEATRDAARPPHA